MSLLAVRFLMGLAGQNEHIFIDAAQGITRRIGQQRDPDCPLHMAINNVTKLPLNHQCTLAKLLRLVGADSMPLAWHPVQNRAECLCCEYQNALWKLPEQQACPQCGATLRIHTTLELANAPDSMSLAQLGIAPQEILAVRGENGIFWIELSR
jgi:hypothetical protein